MKRYTIKLTCLFLFLIVLVGCSSDKISTQVVTSTSTLTLTPTKTKRPTNTPRPTNTKLPTYTPRPTATNTPIPDPIILEGTGDDVFEINKWDSIAILDIEYTGSGNFAVKTHDRNRDYLDLLVNTIGTYQGRVIIDLYDDEETKYIEVIASGPWKIKIMPPGREAFNNGFIDEDYLGAGDDVIYVSDDPLKGSFICDVRGNFSVKAISTDGIDLLVNEIAPYEGTVLIPKNTVILIVHAPGEWKMILK